MVTGGLVAESLKLVFGNEDVLMGIVGIVVFVSIIFIAIDMYRELS